MRGSHPATIVWKHVATGRDRWARLRPRLRMFPHEAKHGYLLLRIYLDKGKIDNAPAALTELRAAYT